MVLLQAMFTVAIEWGEASANPVSVVRKPRQGRKPAIAPLAPEAVERLDCDSRVAVTVPERVEASADELAPALATA